MGQKSKQKEARRKANIARNRTKAPAPKIPLPSKTTYEPPPGDDKPPEVSPRTRSALAVARAMSDAEPPPVGELLKGEVLSEEDRAFELAKRCALRLLKEDKYAAHFGSMIKLRQAWIILYTRLQKMLSAELGLHPMTEDFIIQAILHKSSGEFDGHEVMEMFPRTVMRVLSDIMDEDTVKDNEEIQKIRKENEDTRRAIPLPWPFSLEHDENKTEWSRKTTLVLAGWRPAIFWIVDRIVRGILAHPAGLAVLRLREGTVEKEDLTGSLNLHIGSKAWQGCCNTHNDLIRMFFDYGRGLAHYPDLLVCENLAMAHTKSFVGRLPGAIAGDAHRIFRKWCDESGCGLVGLMPSSTQKPPDTTTKEYEQIRSFAVVRRVEVKPIEDDYEVRIANSGISWRVPKQDLDQREQTKLVVPDFALVK